MERPFPKPDDYITVATRTYSEQLDFLKRFLRERATWMDAHLPASSVSVTASFKPA